MSESSSDLSEIKINEEVKINDEYIPKRKNSYDHHNGYTVHVENQINRIYEKTAQRKFLHEYSENASELRNKIICYPTRLINTVTASVAGLNMVDDNFSVMTLSVMSIISSVLSMTNDYLSYPEKIQKHKTYKNKFIGLINYIEGIMVLPVYKRPEACTFLKRISDDYTNFTNGASPSISTFGKYALEKELKNNPEMKNSIFKLQSLNNALNSPTHSPKNNIQL